MKGVVVKQWGDAPHYGEVDDLETPAPDSKLIQLTVKATGLHQLVKGRAAGTHYSAKTLPHLPGVDGVGTAADGKDYYFSTLVPFPGASQGSYADKVNAFKMAASPLPPGSDPVQVAGLFNPAMSSWMALTKRTTNLPSKFTAVILGATSMSGRVAASLAKVLGAGTVIGVARNKKTLEEIPNLDIAVPLADKPEETDFSAIPKDGVDVVLDYIYGPTFIALFKHLTPTTDRPLQYVQIGSIAEREASFPAELLRFKEITMRGTGPGAWSPQQLGQETPKILEALTKVPKQNLKVLPLKDIAEGWASKERVVFTS